MELKEGYKQTEVGLIPEDWEIFHLGELFSFSGGHTASRDQLSRDGFCYLHYGDIHKSNKTYINVKNEYQEIPKLNVPIKMVSHISLLNDGDVVFVDASEDDEGASKHIVVQNQDEITYISGLHTIVSKSKNDYVYNGYKQHCFQTADVKKQFKFYAVGTKVSGISKANIAKIQIPLPPTKAEQTAIAVALSDADALTQSLEKLIAKKRNIKQGAMQELLKPKEGWGEDKIKNLATITTGAKNTQDRIEDGQFPFFVRSQTVEQINSYSFDGEAVLTAGDGVGTGKIYHYINGKFDFHQRVYKISEFVNKLNGYYFYLYFSNNFFNRIMQMTAKSSVDSVRLEMIADMLIPLPIITEQTRIAAILSDMDNEIAALETKLEKYKMIKQGMMQELLTGRTRLG